MKCLAPLFFFFGLTLVFTLPNKLMGQAPQINFEKYGVAEGLHEKNISSLLQDQQGFIWFTTQNGLVKYDGYSFKTYRAKSNDSVRESGNLKLKYLTGQMIEAKDGKLWLGGIFSPGGMASFDPKTEKFENFMYEPDNPESILRYRNCYLYQEDGFGNIWFSNRYFPRNINLLSRLDPREKKVSHYSYAVNGRINEFLIGSANFAIAPEDGSTWLLDKAKNLRKWNPETDSFEINFRRVIFFPDSSTRDHIRRLYPGLNSKLILIGDRGVYLWDPVAEKVDQFYVHDPQVPSSLSPGVPLYAFEDCYGRYWVKNQDTLNISVIDPQSQTCTRYRYGEGKLALPNSPTYINGVRILVSDSTGLLFQTYSREEAKRGYLFYDFASESFQYYDAQFNSPKNEFPPSSNVRGIRDRNNLVWISSFGGSGGFYRQAPKNQQMALYRHEEGDPYSLPSDAINYLMEDSKARVWVGTPKGLVQYIPEQDHFRRMNLGHKDSTYAYITKIFEDSKGQIWIGGAEGLRGLFLFEESSETYKQIPVNTEPAHGIYAIFEDNQQRLWVSVAGSGVYVLDIHTHQVLSYFAKAKNTEIEPDGLHTDVVTTIFQDSNNRFWLGDYRNNQGLYRLKEDESGFDHFRGGPRSFRKIAGQPIYFITEDIHKGLWVGTEQGLNKYVEGEDENFEIFGDPLDIFNLYAFTQTEDGNLWLGTYGGSGLVHLNTKTLTYRSFGKEHGLLHQDTSTPTLSDRALAVDHFGKVWYPNSRGLSVFDPATERFQNYFEKDGYHPYSLSNVSMVRKNGEVWLGSPYGLNRIDPEKLMQKDSTLPAVYITAVGIMDSLYSAPDGDIFKQTPSFTQKIELQHHQNDLSFEFVALHYLRSEANQYAWKMENYDENWSKASLERQANYTNLDPGTYTFRVKASNADGIWNEAGASMTIVINPPWWATWWAMSLFVALILGIGYLIYRYQLGRQLDQAEAQRLKELDSVKTRLYTNITHEFRTPLTVIKGMAEQIEEQPQTSKKLILRNSNQLLNLVNQMLDLSKLESGKLTLDLIQGNIIAYLQYLTESFHSLAENKEIELVFYPEVETLNMDYDAEKLQLIVSNLLSNAIKFSPEGSKIILHVQQFEKEGNDILQLKVRDKGIGIPADKLPQIFERFYQVDDSTTRKEEGTGIGLTLTKELVNLIGGTIAVESKVNKGTTFTIQLPVTRNAAFATEITKPELASQLSTAIMPSDDIMLLADEDLAQILIIEDNPDVILYIQSCLKDSYRLLTAENGAIGIQQALEHTPDLIISDVMMPEKDGFEVCQTLKSDERSSHIPIILLTARADVESRLAGLKEGADAYLAKPFEKRELLIRIEQLIQLRQKLQVRYRNLHGTPVVTEGKYEREDGFIRKIKMIIEERLSDDELNVEQLARELGMSRSQLFRKLKALTDKSAVAFIRSYRLGRARQLLRTTELSVSEVAYEVGFQSPSYFSKAFLVEFGVSPGETRK